MKRLNILEAVKDKYPEGINPDLIYLGLAQSKSKVVLEMILNDNPDYIIERDLKFFKDEYLTNLEPPIQAGLFNPSLNIDDNVSRFLLKLDPVDLLTHFEEIFSKKTTDSILKQTDFGV
ncbi:hypothetical protein [Psychroflexus aestuariivivens]|uniref:hypothetical protein n=1 Tax=Psychroflexus aestuariivivens TaxID=1795040 RepID=UPI000FD942F3|nr:hypothetical protein [Psychroflexus aestuariivivens]